MSSSCGNSIASDGPSSTSSTPSTTSANAAVHSVSLQKRFGTTTAGGEFLFCIMAALAQMERRMIVERTMSASKLPTVMTPERSALVRALREQGKSLDAIASTLGVGRSPVSQVRADQSGSLRNSAMVGPNESNRAILLLIST